jgi:proteic killer suppression protein
VPFADYFLAKKNKKKICTALKDMNYLGSYLHALSGDRKGQYSVRVSGNWRVIFEFVNGDVYIVDYDDYH